MNHTLSLRQQPEPGTRFLRFRGDAFVFELELSAPAGGRAWIRTNVGHGATTRQEILAEVDSDIPRLNRDWFDVPMVQADARRFRIRLPLSQVGHFEAKCFFLPDGSDTPVWPEGGNVSLNVSPAHTCCFNTIYNAFIRQFGPNKHARQTLPEPVEDGIRYLDQATWSVIPPSGRFRDLAGDLDFIVKELGCRFLQLLPVHPTPTTYARMGRFGSPYAAQSFTAVDPALAEFDPSATPLEQFVELVDAVHARGAEVILDIAINHTGWAASLHGSHPEWLARDEHGRIEVPGAWGVTWADLTRLDYSHKGLWKYMAGIFLTWCERGVDGFRCDAGYMIPVDAWRYMIARVREQFPDTVFLLEGLGGKISVTRELLDRGGFDWAYSELFQNYDRPQIEHYLPEALEISSGEGTAVHFSETHDNNRLAGVSRRYARMRNALCALFSANGGYGFAGGVEWYATEKINVHEAPSLNWGAADNQVAWIRRLTTLLAVHPAFHARTGLRLLHQDGEKQVALLREPADSRAKLLILVNLDPDQPGHVAWESGLFDTASASPVDLLTGETVACNEPVPGRSACLLAPGRVVCLSGNPQDMARLDGNPNPDAGRADQLQKQRLRAVVLDVIGFYQGVRDLGGMDLDAEAGMLAADPVQYCRSKNPAGEEARVVVWSYPQDHKREVMIPPDHFLLIRAPHAFRAAVRSGGKTLRMERSLTTVSGESFVLFTPLPVPESLQACRLAVSVFAEDRPHHVTAALLLLPAGEGRQVRTCFNHREILRTPLLFLGTNARGGMLRTHVAWPKLMSKYDAVLAANLHPNIPVDRWIMLSRCRMWCVFQGYSQEIDANCLDSFQYDPRACCGIWKYRIPAGQGEYVQLDIRLEMVSGKNEIGFTFFRHPCGENREMLTDAKPVRLIIRPDIEDRSFHQVTKAYTGPEHAWPAAVKARENGFLFSPAAGRELDIRVSAGSFVWEPEWYYMVCRPQEQERGQDPDSDLFSPGYFALDLAGGRSAGLVAGHRLPGRDEIKPPDRCAPDRPPELPASVPLADILTAALDQYVVQREDHQSVIAGYPWFLDWGRDSLIVARGLIAAGKYQAAASVLELFGQFEDRGTLPNMIHGDNAENRDTSDAPLWFFVACSELAAALGDDGFFSRRCGCRTFREILVSIGNAMIHGTPNRIRMDPESGLLFSPSHYTWMDTNHPAGTPREGYPVEIQALWHYAVSVLARIDAEADRSGWTALQQNIRSSIQQLFYRPETGYLMDCLHGESGTPARLADPDDSLRPNQLFAVSLGAVDDPEIARSIVEACQALIVPGGIRSLADRQVSRPLPIVHRGNLLNDPDRPYQGRYTGDEDLQRKPAYHNGTAWTWVFPTFCEAWARAFGGAAFETALAWLGSSVRLLHRGCVGHIPEILDGDYPHTQRGCDAQAWGVSELLRVWNLLLYRKKQYEIKGDQHDH